MAKRYDAQINVTIEVPDEEEFLANDFGERPDTVEDGLTELIESDQPTFELGLSGVTGFMVAVEKVSYLDG